MEVITGPVGNGVQGIAELNPYAGVLFGGMVVIIIVLWKALADRTTQLNAEKDARRADKDKVLEQAQQDKDFYERLVEQAQNSKRRAT